MNLTIDSNVFELSTQELALVDGGKMSLNEARLVAFCIGGLVGLALFEIGRNT